MKHDFVHEYADLEHWHWWFRGRQNILERILRREMPDGPARSILSVGCGPAEGLKWLVPLAGSQGRVVGIDRVALYGNNLPQGVEFFTGSLEETAFPDSAFDVILALDVLEHLENDTAGLRAIVRLLKPGGLLVITVPAFPFLWGSHDLVSEHYRRYTKRSLRSLLQRGHVDDARITYFNTLLFPVAATIRIGRRLLGTAKHARSDFKGQSPGMFNNVLTGLLSAEKYLINHVPLPFGTSLLATYRGGSAGESG